MYVRRFRPDGAADVNRYRGRIAIAHPVAVGGRTVKPFASYEAYYERQAPAGTGIGSGPASRCRSNRRVLIQPSYMWESSSGSRDVHYLLFGLIVNTR